MEKEDLRDDLVEVMAVAIEKRYNNDDEDWKDYIDEAESALKAMVQELPEVDGEAYGGLHYEGFCKYEQLKDLFR